MCNTCICVGGNFELLVYEWVPIFRAQVLYMNGVGFGNDMVLANKLTESNFV